MPKGSRERHSSVVKLSQSGGRAIEFIVLAFRGLVIPGPKGDPESRAVPLQVSTPTPHLCLRCSALDSGFRGAAPE